MERLTKRLNDGKELCIDVCGEKCVDGYTWCPKCKPFTDVMKKLAEYEDAEEQGLLLRLPCKVGETVYVLTPKKNDYIETDVKRMVVYDNDIDIVTCICVRSIKEIGKTVFLSREEAEQALARMKEV